MDHMSAMVLSEGKAMVADDDMAGYYVDSVSTSDDEGMQTNKHGGARQSHRAELTETSSGIVWKFASQGL